MTLSTLSRRSLLGTGICALAAVPLSVAAAANAGTGLSVSNESIIRRYYAGWQSKDWGVLDALLADNFTFTSAAPDDHISKTAFKKQCWDTQNALIAGHDLELVCGSGDEALVKYLCRTTKGSAFRNVEYLHLRDKKLVAIECYFGGPGYPSAANTRHT
ncbi:MAG TPA: nuclear transport factor 2 family protein [Steroidobacteraceae bacterium]|jgi:ketosteroid isomerase-like protein|nr:nuclear transport factor 2 family protein [Steroidobacteraceae bacterium]